LHKRQIQWARSSVAMLQTACSFFIGACGLIAAIFG
jgi:hypothetical protein